MILADSSKRREFTPSAAAAWAQPHRVSTAIAYGSAEAVAASRQLLQPAVCDMSSLMHLCPGNLRGLVTSFE